MLQRGPASILDSMRASTALVAARGATAPTAARVAAGDGNGPLRRRWCSRPATPPARPGEPAAGRGRDAADVSGAVLDGYARDLDSGSTKDVKHSVDTATIDDCGGHTGASTAANSSPSSTYIGIGTPPARLRTLHAGPCHPTPRRKGWQQKKLRHRAPHDGIGQREAPPAHRCGGELGSHRTSYSRSESS